MFNLLYDSNSNSNLKSHSIWLILIILLNVNFVTIKCQGCPFYPSYKCEANVKYRTLDGTCNNMRSTSLASANTCVARILPPDYGLTPPNASPDETLIRVAKDGKELPNARDISNRYMKDKIGGTEDSQYNMMFYTVGVFLSEDISQVSFQRRYPYSYQIGQDGFPCCATSKIDYANCAPIYFSRDDEFFKQFNVSCFNMIRSISCETCDNQVNGKVRKQLNKETAFFDMSRFYGLNVGANEGRRLLRGGLLRTSTDNYGNDGLMPRRYKAPDAVDTNDACWPKKDSVCYRGANLAPILVTFFSLLYRTHNRIATRLSLINKHWDDQRLFQETRRILTAQVAHVIYSEYLPRLLGPYFMARYDLFPAESGYTEYNVNFDPNLLIEFSSAAFRFAHSATPDKYMEVFNQNGREIVEWSEVKDQWYHPIKVYLNELQRNSFLRGMTRQGQHAVGPAYANSVRNHNTQPSGAKYGQDLGALDIQRGREHGIKGYVYYVKYCQNITITRFDQLGFLMPEERWRKLGQIYTSVEDIDLLIGGLSETPVAGVNVGESGQVGPTFACIIGQQMNLIKFGDRFHYENANQVGSFRLDQLNVIRKTTLSGIICYNAARNQFDYDKNNFEKIQPQSMDKISSNNPLLPCTSMYDILPDLTLWREAPPRSAIKEDL